MLRKLLIRVMPSVKVKSPVFIVGCGRSGTTSLGETLQQHPSIVYFNEPRDIWQIDPRTDIWSQSARRRFGQLSLSADDVTDSVRKQIHYAFKQRLNAEAGSQLLEKLPINTFRIAYLHALFPDAKFIHLIRNGAEVARSIARKVDEWQWYGHNDYKWKLLSLYAESIGLGDLVEHATPNYFLRGALEWRLSVSACLESANTIPDSNWLEIRYEDWVTIPAELCAQLLEFIDLQLDDDMLAYAKREINRQTSRIESYSPDSQFALIAGRLMQKLGYQ